MQAIKLACQDLTDLIRKNPEHIEGYTKVVILSDSKPALLSLKSIDTKSKITKDAKLALNDLSKIIPVELEWVRAHKGIIGNEIADRAAKSGVKMRPNIEIGHTKQSTKQVVVDHIYDTWNSRWNEQRNCRQTKLFMPSIDRGKSSKIMNLTKSQLSVLVRHITGHAHMDKHRKTIGDYGNITTIDEDFLRHISEINQPMQPSTYQACPTLNTVDTSKAIHYGTCRLCEIAGSEETPYHILMECPYTWRGRAEALKVYDASVHDLKEWEPASIVKFFTRYNVEDLK